MAFSRGRYVVRSLLPLIAIVAAPAGGAQEPPAAPPTTPPPASVTQDPAVGTPAATPAEKPKEFDLWSQKKLTGDWGGVRSKLEDAGVQIKIDLMNQMMVNMHVGRETKNGHDTAGSYEIDFIFDLDKLLDIKNATFFMRGKGTWGGDDSDFDREKVGGLFKTNQDADIEEPIFVDKWWWKQLLFDKKLEIRLGRMEPVKDLFDTSKIMGHEDYYFMNRALVRNATIPANKGLGAYVNWNINDDVYVRAAALDAQSQDRQTNFNTAFHDQDWYRFYGEVGITPEFASDHGELWGHYRVGTWYDPTPKRQFRDTLGGTLVQPFQAGDWGFYTGFDQKLWKEVNDAKDEQGFAVAARFGMADGEVNQIEYFWALATQYIGPIPERNKDMMGVGVGQGILSDELRRVNSLADRETVYELYYAVYMAPWLTVTYDLQYITNTGGDKNDPDTAVAGIRVRMNL